MLDKFPEQSRTIVPPVCFGFGKNREIIVLHSAIGVIITSPEKEMVAKVARIHEFIEILQGISRCRYVEKEKAPRLQMGMHRRQQFSVVLERMQVIDAVI